MSEGCATPSHATSPPSPWVTRFAHLVAADASVLDLACGHGRHSRFFAERGCRVRAVDRDPQALATLAGTPGVTTRCSDLETGGWPFGGERFDAIVVTNYLHRPLFAHLLDALADDGVLIYETFAQGNEAYGRPSNPDHLLRAGELVERIAGRLAIVAFEEGLVTEGGRSAVVQRIAAVGLRRNGVARLAAGAAAS